MKEWMLNVNSPASNKIHRGFAVFFCFFLVCVVDLASADCFFVVLFCLILVTRFVYSLFDRVDTADIANITPGSQLMASEMIPKAAPYLRSCARPRRAIPYLKCACITCDMIMGWWSQELIVFSAPMEFRCCLVVAVDCKSRPEDSIKTCKGDLTHGSWEYSTLRTCIKSVTTSPNVMRRSKILKTKLIDSAAHP